MKNTTPETRKKENHPKNPVLRRLRIEFIITMMSIVVAFLLIIFGFQYITSKRTMEDDSLNAMNRALNNTAFPWNRDDFKPDGSTDLPSQPDGDVPPSKPEDSDDETSDNDDDNDDPDDMNDDRKDHFGHGSGDYHIADFKNRQDRVATLVAYYETDGSVNVARNNIFFIDTEDVSSLVVSAVSRDKDTGKIDDHNLRYMKKTMANGTIAVAFADISNEEALLSSELARSLWIGLGVFAVMLALSFWLSRITTRPVERAWNDQRRFVADASHELKTPLTVIMSNTDMVERSLKGLVDEAEPDAESTDISVRKLQRNLHRVDNVKEESLRMKELIGELLEVARGDVGHHADSFVELSLSEIAEDSLLTWESVFFEAGKTLKGQVEPNLSLTGDRTLLRRLIEILVDNALKYSKEGSEVTLSLKKEKIHGNKRQIHLSVANEGTPLTREEISHLFDRFYRADSSREKTSGYGLGLSIAESIVTAHHGKIWAEPSETGNVFHVAF